MRLKLCPFIIFLIIYLVTLIRYLASEYTTQQALQWWSCRQSLKLFQEAEKIRDGLLQDSFAIRRSLEMLPLENSELAFNKTQDCLKQIDQFDKSLVQLSDRLFPVYLQDSLPLAIHCLLEPWRTCHPHLSFYINMPAYWRQERVACSLTVVRALDELLRITLPEVLMPISIDISLEEQQNIGQLIVRITYPETHILIYYYNLTELKFLCKTFQVLTSGKCFYQIKNLSVVWYFCWK